MSSNSLPGVSPFRHKVGHFLQRSSVQRSLLALILLNAVLLGLETSNAIMQAVGPALLLFDKIILAVFVLEIGLRISRPRGPSC